MVLKAVVKGDETFLLCCDPKKVSSNEYIMSFRSGTLPSKGSLVCFRSNRILNIPQRYELNFNPEDYSIKDLSSHSSSVLQKEMTPDIYIEDKPLIGGMSEDCGWFCYDDHALCTNSQLRSSTGRWEICGNRVVYDFKLPIKALRINTKRHRPDNESEQLILNLDTNECVLNQRYFKGNMVRETYKFNKEYRVWVLSFRDIENDIIGIKR